MTSRLSKALVVSATAVMLAAPTFALAAFQIDSNGNFNYRSGSVDISVGSGGPGGIGCTRGSICQVAGTALYLINRVLVPLIFAISFLLFLYGIGNAYIFSGGDPKKVEVGHKVLLWGIIGFAIMISLWGIVNVAATTFGLTGYGTPPLPTSY